MIIFKLALLVLAGSAKQEASLVRVQQEQFHYEQLRQIQELESTLKEFMREKEDAHRSLEDFLEIFQPEEVEITGYAPLDPRAIEGMCFTGNPNITYSGEPVQIGVTVAAGPEIPIGTRVWIQGHGWRVVQDRGGGVVRRNLDIAVETREEAFAIGRRSAIVVFEK